MPALCHVLFTFCFCVLYTKKELRGKRGEIPRRAFLEEGNLRMGIFGGESSQRGIFEEGNFPGGESSLRGMFGGEFSEGNFR